MNSGKNLGVYLNTALDAAKKAGEVLRQYWGNIQAEEKGHSGDLVTQADRDAEKEIIQIIRSRHPDHSIIAEETGGIGDPGAEFQWAVDPLDGTTNYAHQFPLVAVSIALIKGGQPIVGVIYNPIQEELYHAVQGEGAYLNGHPMVVSEVDTLEKSLLVTGFAYDRRETFDNNYAEFIQLTNISQGVRRLGSAALDLAYVARGCFDGFWERGLSVWDLAAGVVLVRESGGRVSSYDDSPLDLFSGRILATNGRVHGLLSQALVEVKKTVLDGQAAKE